MKKFKLTKEKLNNIGKSTAIATGAGLTTFLFESTMASTLHTPATDGIFKYIVYTSIAAGVIIMPIAYKTLFKYDEEIKNIEKVNVKKLK